MTSLGAAVIALLVVGVSTWLVYEYVYQVTHKR